MYSKVWKYFSRGVYVWYYTKTRVDIFLPLGFASWQKYITPRFSVIPIHIFLNRHLLLMNGNLHTQLLKTNFNHAHLEMLTVQVITNILLYHYNESDWSRRKENTWCQSHLRSYHTTYMTIYILTNVVGSRSILLLVQRAPGFYGVVYHWCRGWGLLLVVWGDGYVLFIFSFETLRTNRVYCSCSRNIFLNGFSLKPPAN